MALEQQDIEKLFFTEFSFVLIYESATSEHESFMK